MAGKISNKCYVDTECLVQEATADVSLVDPKWLYSYVEYLDRLEKSDLAHKVALSIDRSSAAGPYQWQSALRDIALREVATKAINSPDVIADFSPITKVLSSEQTPSGFDLSQYFLIADVITHTSPWGGMDTDVSNIFRPKALRKSANATLLDILNNRWPKAIEELPDNQQGRHWSDLAKAWLELGDSARAAEFASRAEKTGSLDFKGANFIFSQTWRIWLALGNYDRALQATDRETDRGYEAHFKLDIARSLIETGQKETALGIIASALTNARLEPSSNRKMGYLGGVVNARIVAGDIDGARQVAEEMKILAHKQSIVPAGQLALAAAIFNNLDDYPSAARLLSEALSKVPGSSEIIGHGVSLGTITGARLGLADSLKSEIAVEFYRSGDLATFDHLLKQLNKADQAGAWLNLCESSQPGHWMRPSEEECVDGTAGEIFRHLAVEAVVKENNLLAGQYLSRMISKAKDASLFSVNHLLNAARIAFVTNDKSLTNSALIAAAKAADGLANAGDRELKLAAIAALRKELLP